MFKEEKPNNSMLNEDFDDFYDANNNNNYKKFTNYKLNKTNSNNNSREQYSRDSYDYENNLERSEKPDTQNHINANNNNTNSKQFTPANSIHSNNNSFKTSPLNKRLAQSLNSLAVNQEDKLSVVNTNLVFNTNHNSNNSYRKATFDSNTNSFEKDSVATASDSISLNSTQDNSEPTNNNTNYNNNRHNIIANNNNNTNRQYKPNNNITNNNNNNNQNSNQYSNNINQSLNTSVNSKIQPTNGVKNPKVISKIEEKTTKPNLPNLKLEENKATTTTNTTNKLKEVATTLVKEKQMKSRNNQSTFAKNPTQSYAEPYYASFPPNTRPPKIPVSYYDFTAQFSPREVIYPYIVPSTLGPLAPVIPAAFPYQSPTGVYSYNLWMRPLILDEKNPSIHDLLYYETFHRNKDVPYASKHIEKKIRAVDGFYNPYGRYTLQDYRNLKANEAFATNPNELDPETKDEKAEKMHKRQEIGNLFMKSNPKPARKPLNLNEPVEPLPLPPPQRKQVNLQDPFDLKNPKIRDSNGNNNGDQPFTSRNNMGQSLDFDEHYFDGNNNAKNYNPSFFNNSLNGFPNNDINNNKRPNNLNNSYNNVNGNTTNNNNNGNNNNKVDWINFDDTIKDDIKLTQSQRLIQINHPMKKVYKNPKFNFSEKPVEAPVVETRARAMEYAKRIKE